VHRDLRWIEKGKLPLLTVPDCSTACTSARQRRRKDFITIDRSDDNAAFIKVRCKLPPPIYRLPGRDEVERRLENRVEIVSYISLAGSVPAFA
jgi:hypothetical protein